MTDQELIRALRGAVVETGSLLCLGCGHEHNCSVHGCAIIRAAAERLETLSADEPPNDPLTLEELREMDGDPVWVQRKLSTLSGWEVIRLIPNVEDDVEFTDGLTLPLRNYGKTWLAYRRSRRRTDET